ncbi:SAF domain-containing protein [Catenuloplanes japonicus]|uniref:SAF domain-containing protein n=1 Tax=Catenuloplanes japonicus TaxID=33876 RepID=UPI000525F478|nr:SAF domain-containing protein [Catenuloplanes japonicus]
MTLAQARPAPGTAETPIAPPKVVRQRRTRPGLLGLALLLIALGGLGAAFAVNSVRATGQYIGVARPVAVGAVIVPEDLMVVQLGGGQGLTPIAAADQDKVLGRHAAVALSPGSLLTPDQITDKQLLGPGQQQVALGLAPQEIPARALRPGDKVLLVGAPAKQDAAPSEATRFQGVVVDTVTPTDTQVVTSDMTVVYVSLAEKDAAAVVLLHAQQRISVVLQSGS